MNRLQSRWRLAIEVIDRDGRVHVLTRRAPLKEIAVVDDGISITVGTTRRLFTHFVERPVSMALEKTSAGVARGIRLIWRSGITTILKFIPAASAKKKNAPEEPFLK
jgi:hypothetical protein